MANPSEIGAKAANSGAAAPNTSGLSRTQAQQAQKAYNDQKAKNASK